MSGAALRNAGVGIGESHARIREAFFLEGGVDGSVPGGALEGQTATHCRC